MEIDAVIDWKDKIKALFAISEEMGALHPEILEIAYQKQWFKLFVPEVYGGAGMKLPEILRLEEELAELDGSLGWTVTLCAGAGWFAGFLDKQLAKEIFSDPKICFAGSGAVGGTAVETNDGYIIDGFWKYASGALHATIFTANCIIKTSSGEDLLDDEGKPLVKSFILFKDEVEIISGWSYFGLVATGSHAFKVERLLVPSNRTFVINDTIKIESEGFDYPFLQLAETTLAVNSLGMAIHFIALVEAQFKSRSGIGRYSETQIAFFNVELERWKKEVEHRRTAFYKAFDASWAELQSLKYISEETRMAVSKNSRILAHRCREAADALFPYCGLAAAQSETEVNRVWRDLHTASQHALLTFID